MVQLTATLTFTIAPDSPLMIRTWQKIAESGAINERIADLFLIEPGFGLYLDSVEDAEISGVDE